MEAELEPRRDAEVAASASKPPQELRVLIGISADHGATGRDQLGADEVVARETVLRRQVADPAAERETGDSGRADHASGGDEAGGLRRRVELEPPRAALGAGGPRVAVDLDPPHQREVDHEPAVAHAVPGGVVPASSHRHLEPARAREIERRRHVAGAEAARDHRRPAVDEGVEAAPGRVVAGVGRGQHGAGQRAPQLGRALVHSRFLLLAPLSYTRITTPSPTVLDSFEPHRLLVARLAEHPIAGAEDHREDHHVHLVDEIGLDQLVHEPPAAGNLDDPVDLLA